MAKAWIQDRWLQCVDTMLPDGTVLKIEAPAEAKRSLAMNMTHPEKARVPEIYQSTEYGRGARWIVYWHSDEGRKRKSFQERKKAEEFMASLEDDLRSGRYINPKNTEKPFGEVAQLWANTLTGKIKGSTENRYLRELRIWVMPRWGSVPLGRITTGVIQAWVAQLVQGTAPRDGMIGQPRPLAAKSIRSIVAIVMGAVLKHAISLGWMQTNPMTGVTMPKTIVSAPRVYLTPPEVKAIADQMTPSNATLIYTLAYTGIRIGEALAIRCEDVDFDARTIMISKTQSIDRNGLLVETLPKGNRTRRVPVPAAILPRLLELTEGQPDGGYLFRAPRGGRWSVNNWRSRIWYPALQAAGMDEIDGLVIHSLRHTYASIAIKAGADVKTLQAVMGHASATETLDTYADLWPARTSEVADAVNKDILL